METRERKSLDAKIESFAKIIDGRVVHDETRVAICIKGTVAGFPATMEAIGAGWPFGVNYFIETEVVEAPSQDYNSQLLKLTILPRVAHGIMSFLARILLVEAKGQRVGDRRLENEFIISYNNAEEAHRFCQHPGVYDKLVFLHRKSKFTELLVKADAGLWMAQPVNFKSLNPDLFKETFHHLAELGQVLCDAF